MKLPELPPPCVNKSSPEWIKYRFQLWQNNNREYLNEYTRNNYRKNILRERERHRMYYHKRKNTPCQLTPEQITFRMEQDRLYREEMIQKGIIL